MPNVEHICLLSENEIADLYARPDFNSIEQSLYFSLTDRERVLFQQYSTIKTKVFFILQLGYFKAKHQFFKFKLEEVGMDVDYILANFFNQKKRISTGQLSPVYYRQQKKDILRFFSYKEILGEQRSRIEAHIVELLRYYPKGHNALRQLFIYLDKQRIVLPSYRKLQDMFTAAFSSEGKRLAQSILSIPHYQQKQLLELLNRNDDISPLNIIRADQRDFQYTAVITEVEKAQSMAGLYLFAKQFIPTLKLSKNAVRYYAEVTEQYAASRLRRLSKSQQLLHTICFIYHRYQQIMDNLIISFMYHVQTILDAGKTYAELAQLKHSSELVVDFPRLAQFLKWFPKRDKELTHEELNQIAYTILPEEQFSMLAKFLEGNTFDEKASRWEFYFKSSRTFSLYLRPILLTVPFVFYKENSQLMELVNLLKTHYFHGKHPSSFKLKDDLGFTIPKNMLPYLKRNAMDEYVNPYLFEFFVYQKMYHQLNRGKLCCNDSVSYCDIDCDLVNELLVNDAHKIATEFGYPKIPIYCDQRLEDALQNLDNAWRTTTENIGLGNNAGFHVKESKTGKTEWSLLYDSLDPLDDTFFKTLPKIEIADLVMFIGDHIGMWDGFTHVKDRYVKRKQPIQLAINACLLSEAFGFGILKMADMSDLTFNLLRATREDFIRVDTLCTTNNLVANYIYSLPIFKLWDLLENKILADADGQKFATTQDTIQSRYSKKYLGKGKGISLYTLIANFVAVNAKNIGLNEYEGHFLYDMIYSNKTDIDIDMVTGDNHSLNQLNFIALDSIDVDYVPSIKNVREAADDLYSVKSPDYYTGLIKPKAKINVERIKSQKKGILRVLLSLILQENTQSNIIRKLNSHARYARLKAGLFEYNKLFKSIHVLNLIDSMLLRKAIRNARNRTEAYHQLQRLIRKIYSGIFKGKKIVDNRVSAHATRLIANIIIAYNSIILNIVYVKMVKENVAQEVIEEFARISPIAWTHILLTGRYSFKNSSGINVAAMAELFETHLKQHFLKAI